jgi:iron-sulfur cluster repair protein YtfE (RIC family)
MKAIDRLRRDHRILRSKLDVIEAALRMGPETWYVLREVCFTLARQLRSHMQREEDLVMACRKVMKPHVLAEMAVEHRDEPEHLRTINRLFVEEHGHTLDRIRPVLTEVIQGLRRHMTEEERDLFPILERELAEREPAKVHAQGASESRLQDCMTVNGVLHLYPMTKNVFERLFVNVPFEGCDCLDEVAWRRGMDVEELLDRLEQSVLSAGSPVSEVAREQGVCACR